MGLVRNINHDSFPAQGRLGRQVDVCFHYDASHQIRGEIIRDDTESPYVTIIKLEDGRFVLATECMYSG